MEPKTAIKERHIDRHMSGPRPDSSKSVCCTTNSRQDFEPVSDLAFCDTLSTSNFIVQIKPRKDFGRGG